MAVILHNRISNNGISYNCIFGRIVSERLLSSPRRGSRWLTVVWCYAPTRQHSLSNPNLAERIYRQLELVINPVKRKDELVTADLNAKVGSSAPDSLSVFGGFSKHRYNNANGERLVEFCVTRNLVLFNTLFKHRMAHRSTWFADGPFDANSKPSRNMIDLVVI